MATQTSPKRERWSEERIERELQALVKKLGSWPSQSYLLRNSHGGLLSAIQRTGGSEEWAEKLGMALPRTSGGRLWTDERIRQELKLLLKQRKNWPTEREFAEAGLAALYRAIRRHGGHKRWAKRYGFAAPRGGRPPSSS